MCENPASTKHDCSDLGRQDPRGCRYIYGDPGFGPWHYCQRTIALNGKMGDVKNPPYCARHTKVCTQPAKAFKYYGGWEPQVIFRQSPNLDQRMAVDVFIKVGAANASARGLSHD